LFHKRYNGVILEKLADFFEFEYTEETVKVVCFGCHTGGKERALTLLFGDEETTI
jgi:hypothetical protein